MRVLKCLTAAAAALALSISAAAACDDYADEMALAEAMKDSKLAQSTAAEPAFSTQASTAASAQAKPTSVAAVEAKPAADTSAPTVRQ